MWILSRLSFLHLQQALHQLQWILSRFLQFICSELLISCCGFIQGFNFHVQRSLYQLLWTLSKPLNFQLQRALYQLLWTPLNAFFRSFATNYSLYYTRALIVNFCTSLLCNCCRTVDWPDTPKPHAGLHAQPYNRGAIAFQDPAAGE